MRNRTALAIALMVLLQAASAAPGADGKPEKSTPVVLKGLDPIDLLAGNQVAGAEAISSAFDGFRYRFATAEHKALFDANTGRYSVQGRMCSAMPTVPASPDIYLVHEGKIYLFGSTGCRAGFKADPATFLKPRKKVAILVYEGMELLDFAGPGEVFANAGRGRGFELFTVAATSAPIQSQGFVSITPRYTFGDSPKADVLVIPGGSVRIPSADPATIAWIRKASAEAEVTLSVCTGAILLARAGLLDGLEATTHHQSIVSLGEAAPKATVRKNRRFVDNGRIITSGGVSSGIDASLHLVSRMLGPDAASEAAEMIEYRWEPPKNATSR